MRTAKQKAASVKNIKKAQAARREKGKRKGKRKGKKKNNPGTLKGTLGGLLKEYGGPAAGEAAQVVLRKVITKHPKVAAALLAGKTLKSALGK